MGTGTLLAGSELVERLLPMDEAIAAMRETLGMLARGGASMPLRSFIALPHGAALGLMPSQIDDLDAVGVKVTGIFPRDEGLIGDDHVVGELGEVVIGSAPAREKDDPVTVLKSLGLAVEDLAGAHRVVGMSTPKRNWASWYG